VGPAEGFFDPRVVTRLLKAAPALRKQMGCFMGQLIRKHLRKVFSCGHRYDLDQRIGQISGIGIPLISDNIDFLGTKTRETMTSCRQSVDVVSRSCVVAALCGGGLAGARQKPVRPLSLH